MKWTPRLATPTPYKCTLCAHAWNRGFVVACTVVTDQLTEEPLPCNDARKAHHACGPRALLFKALSNG